MVAYTLKVWLRDQLLYQVHVHDFRIVRFVLANGASNAIGLMIESHPVVWIETGTTITLDLLDFVTPDEIRSSDT